MRLLFVLLMLSVPELAASQLYPSDPPLLGPITPNAYGPGTNSDATGRPFYWQAPMQPSFPDPTIQPHLNQFGFGQSADQYGRAIQPNMEMPGLSTLPTLPTLPRLQGLSPRDPTE